VKFKDKNICNSDCKTSINIEDAANKILCTHCKRTKSNGIRCMGICISDNDY